jgi:hypothetical protein
MIQGLLIKAAAKLVLKLIIKEDDSVLASGHEKRIKALEDSKCCKNCKCCKNK